MHLATSGAGLHEIATAVTSMPLLPDEDPAPMTGPDRIDLHEVLSYTAVGSPTPA